MHLELVLAKYFLLYLVILDGYSRIFFEDSRRSRISVIVALPSRDFFCKDRRIKFSHYFRYKRVGLSSFSLAF
jgi:hypothetical protein